MRVQYIEEILEKLLCFEARELRHQLEEFTEDQVSIIVNVYDFSHLVSEAVAWVLDELVIEVIQRHVALGLTIELTEDAP